MKNSNLNDLIKYRLEQAEETLKESLLLLEADHLRGAINRAYYSMFYAVLALLITKNLASSKHSGAISFFDREFVKTGKFTKQYSEWLHELFDFRQEVDYGPVFHLSQENCRQILKNAHIFVSKVKEYLQSNISQ